MKTLKLRRLVVALSVHNEGAKVRKFLRLCQIDHVSLTIADSYRCHSHCLHAIRNCKKEGHFAQACEELSAEGSQVAAMERETAPNHDEHTYFGSCCAGYCLRHSKEI